MQTPIQRAVRFSDLSPPRKKLVRLCQEVNYGSLHGLLIRESEPVFDPPPALLVDIKLDCGTTARLETDLRDFILKDEAVRLMDHLDRLVTTTIELLEVRAGIPRRLILRVPSSEAVPLRTLI
jgi:hypothetical protein